jgi:hypothetical protein
MAPGARGRLGGLGVLYGRGGEMNVSKHRVTFHAQTWGNTPPYQSRTMYRAVCKCGWVGAWYVYKENVETECCRALMRVKLKTDGGWCGAA